jgi:hypothetical protein
VAVSGRGDGSLEEAGSAGASTVGPTGEALSPDAEGRSARWARAATSCLRHRLRMASQPSVQRSLQARLRMANMALTWLGPQRIPACFMRLCTTSLLALSTDPLPMG